MRAVPSGAGMQPIHFIVGTAPPTSQRKDFDGLARAMTDHVECMHIVAALPQGQSVRLGNTLFGPGQAL